MHSKPCWLCLEVHGFLHNVGNILSMWLAAIANVDYNALTHVCASAEYMVK